MSARDNDALLDAVFPRTKRKRPLKPNESLISIEKAQRVLGYKPQHDYHHAGGAKAAKKAPAKR